MPYRTNPLWPFVAKLAGRRPLSAQAKNALLSVPHRAETFDAHREIVAEGERGDHCWIVTKGLLSRYRSLRNGGRQIVSFHIAGDAVSLPASLLQVADHTIRSHGVASVVRVAARDLLQVASDFPELARAFWFDTLVDGAIFAEWIVNVGRRDARERVGHLLLELAYRLNAVGLGDAKTFALPVTQTDLADATGLSPVHVNRSLRALREQGLISMVGRTVTIEKYDALARETDFSEVYLHPEGPRPLDD